MPKSIVGASLHLFQEFRPRSALRALRCVEGAPEARNPKNCEETLVNIGQARGRLFDTSGPESNPFCAHCTRMLPSSFHAGIVEAFHAV